MRKAFPMGLAPPRNCRAARRAAMAHALRAAGVSPCRAAARSCPSLACGTSTRLDGTRRHSCGPVQEALRRELERASLDLEHFEKEQVQRPAARARARGRRCAGRDGHGCARRWRSTKPAGEAVTARRAGRRRRSRRNTPSGATRASSSRSRSPTCSSSARGAPRPRPAVLCSDCGCPRAAPSVKDRPLHSTPPHRHRRPRHSSVPPSGARGERGSRRAGGGSRQHCCRGGDGRAPAAQDQHDV